VRARECRHQAACWTAGLWVVLLWTLCYHGVSCCLCEQFKRSQRHSVGRKCDMQAQWWMHRSDTVSCRAVLRVSHAVPPQGSVVQRLQRFATYSHLKQVVLRMITEEMRTRGKAPSFGAALQVKRGGGGWAVGCGGCAVGGVGLVMELTGARVGGAKLPETFFLVGSEKYTCGAVLRVSLQHCLAPLLLLLLLLCWSPQELFAAYDKDKNGTISFEELTDGLRGQGYVVNESEVSPWWWGGGGVLEIRGAGRGMDWGGKGVWVQEGRSCLW